MRVTIKSIVQDLPQIDYKQLLYEAITNSIQANATDIKIRFNYNILDFKKEDIKDNEKVLDSIEIIDNGEGFTQKNINAFKEYKTENKIELGCKGVGRFLYLKLFKKVEIVSLDKKIEFVIDKDIEPISINESSKDTIVKLLEPKTKINIEYKDLKSSLREHFIAYFKLLKDKNKDITIAVFEDNSKKFIINSSETPDFKEREFTINRHKFIINYIFNDKNLPNEGYYCAGKRVVKRNSDLGQDKRLKLFKQFSIFYLLESDYLDRNVKSDTRDDFIIYPKRKNSQDLFANISWEEINERLNSIIREIAKENGIDLEELAKTNLQKAYEEAPYLGHYLKYNDLILDYEELIKNAKQRLEEDKKRVRKGNDIDYSKLSIVTQAELAEYIFDREKIIEKLKSLTDEKAIEKEIHDLFKKQKTQDDTGNYRTNNLWLFDDRFMTYDKVFSDKQMKEIFPQLRENLDRPDLLTIASNTYEKDKITDIVVIELKRPDSKNITPAEAREQLLKYARYINNANLKNKIRIWCYAFLKFSDETVNLLEDDDFNQIMTQSKYPIFYKYFEKRNTVINFIDYKTLAYDAELRNKTFLKILKGEGDIQIKE